ncbi:MAG: Ppx/GppA family phosphatase, partial [Cytophagales bacterium]|nr:Ppx/GppA family phosphatase [Cytophagales bacterium]
DETGLTMRVLSGREEAYYGYLGIVNSLPLYDGVSIDIGGGSTEITEVREREFVRGVSMQVGVVRYKDRYVTTDPISKREFAALERGVAVAFQDVNWLASTGLPMLVGVGGTVRNLAKIDQKRRGYPLERIHGYELTLTALEEITELLRKQSITERASMPGLNSDRADLIVPGAVILRQLMRQGHFERLIVGGQALREGLFYEHFLAGQSMSMFDNPRSFNVENLCRLWNYDERHSKKVREICFSLFDQLQPLHGFRAWEREILGYAALMHDIGIQVGYYDHHKHSEYLVVNSALPGFTHREVAMLALLVRGHRKGDLDIDTYAMVLEPGDETRALQLGAMLRLAEYLERTKTQVVQSLRLEFVGSSIIAHVQLNGDGTAELINANQRTKLFRKAFGRDLELVAP